MDDKSSINENRISSSSSLLGKSPTGFEDFDLHKYAIKNGLRMESRFYPCRSEDYEIELLSEKLKLERKEELIETLIENFLHNETLIKSLIKNTKIETESEKNDLAMDERLMMSSVIDEGKLLIAKSKKGDRIAGVFIIMIHDRTENCEKNNEDKKSKLFGDRLKSKVMKNFYKHIEYIQEKTEDIMFKEYYPDCKLFADFEIIAVNKFDRRKGIAYDLCLAGLEYIKNIPNIKIITGTYTSIYSEKIAIKLGKKIITKFDVTQLKDDLGNPIFQDTPPHNFVTLMAMEI